MTVTAKLKLSVGLEEPTADGTLTAAYEWRKSVSSTTAIEVWAVAVGTDGNGKAIAGGGVDTYDTSVGLTTAVKGANATMCRLVYFVIENMSTTATMTIVINNYNSTDDLTIKIRPGGSFVYTDENNQETTTPLGDITITGTAGEKYKLEFGGKIALVTPP